MERLIIHKDRRYLQTKTGAPFFYLADTAWELFHRLTFEEACLYLEDRAAKGFTAIQAVALAELDGLNTPNANGDRPLQDNDPTRPDEAYFAHVDRVVAKANDLGLRLAMLPTWGDKWHPARGAGPCVFDRRNARAYGRFLGERYRDAGILWTLGGDRGVDSEEQLETVRAMAHGLKEGDGGRHLMTFHPPGGVSSSLYVHNEDWLDFHMIQSGHRRDRDNGRMVELDYRRLPRRPCLDGEPGYEDHPNHFNPERGWLGAWDCRKALWWAVLAGAAGHTYGCHDIWQMYEPGRKPISWARTPWREALALEGSAQMRHAKDLLLSRPLFDLVPDNHIVSASQREGRDRLQATRSRKGEFAYVYFASNRTATLDLTCLGSSDLRGRWLDPRTGRWRGEAFPVEGRAKAARLTPPPWGEDWVLLAELGPA